jgi:hypothetical protein
LAGLEALVAKTPGCVVHPDFFHARTVTGLVPVGLGEDVAEVIEVTEVIFFAVPFLLVAFDPEELHSG